MTILDFFYYIVITFWYTAVSLPQFNTFSIVNNLIFLVLLIFLVPKILQSSLKVYIILRL